MSSYLDKVKQSIDVNLEQISKLDDVINSLLNDTTKLSNNTSYLKELTSVKDRLIISTNNMMKEHMISERHRRAEKTANTSGNQTVDNNQDKVLVASRISYTMEGFSNRLQSFLQTKGMELIEAHLVKNDLFKSEGVGNELSKRKVFSYSYPIEPHQTPNDDLIKIIADRYIRYVLDGVQEIYMRNDRLRGRRNLYDLIGEIRVYTSTEKVVIEAHEIKITGLEIVIQ